MFWMKEGRLSLLVVKGLEFQSKSLASFRGLPGYRNDKNGGLRERKKESWGPPEASGGVRLPMKKNVFHSWGSSI